MSTSGNSAVVGASERVLLGTTWLLNAGKGMHACELAAVALGEAAGDNELFASGIGFELCCCHDGLWDGALGVCFENNRA